MNTFFYAKSRTVNSNWEYDRFVSKEECEHYMNELQKCLYPYILKWEEVSRTEFLSVLEDEGRRYIESMNAAYGIC